mgnify:CR=1 FL=1
MEKKEFRKKLLSLVLPITFQKLMLAVVSASDALMVGAIRQDLLSAVSLASQVTFVYNLFLAALTIGTSMFAAQYWGKRDYASVEKILGIVPCRFPALFCGSHLPAGAFDADFYDGSGLDPPWRPVS